MKSMAKLGLALLIAAAAVGCKKEQRDHAASDVERAGERIEEGTRQAAETIGEKGKLAGRELKEEAQQAGDRLEGAFDRTRNEARQRVGDPLPSSGTTEAEARQRESSAQSLKEAQKSAREASEQLEEAAKAERKVADKQRELEEARSEAERERAEARAAQERAGSSATQALQQQPSAEPTTAPAPAPSRAVEQPQTAAGRIASVQGQEIVVERPGQGTLRVTLEPSTTVVIDGRPASTRELSTGADVRVSYRIVADQPVADRVEQAAAAASGGTMPLPGSTSPTPASDMPALPR